MLRHGVVGRRGARVPEPAPHDGEHGAGLGRDRAGEGRRVGPEAEAAVGGGARVVVGLLGDGVDAAAGAAEHPGATHFRGAWRVGPGG